ncbi:MAG: hypothetical protein D6719_13525, partial [Candidatus Dadabacteria bacterium]
MTKKTNNHWPVSVLSSVSSLLNLLLPLVLVRLIERDQIGIYKLFFLYLMVVPELCLSGGLVNGLAYWAGRGRRGLRAIQLTGTLILLLALFSGALLFVFRADLAELLGVSQNTMLAFSAAAAGSVAAVFFEESTIVRGAVWKAAIFMALSDVVRVLAMLAAAFYYRDVEAVLYTFSLFTLLKAGIGYTLAYKMKSFRPVLDRSSVWPVVTYAFPVALAGVFGLLVSHADQFVLSATLKTDEFALYALGCLLVPPLLILEHSVVRVLIPELSRIFENFKSQKARQTGKEFYKNAISQLGLVIIPSFFGLLVFADPIVRLLYTDRYSAAAPYLMLFSFSYLFLIIPFDAVARARGEAHWIMSRTVTFALIGLMLCSLLAYEFGAIGALSGMLLTKALMRTYSLSYTRRVTGWKIREFLPLRDLGIYLAVSMALALVALSGRAFGAEGLGWFAVYGGFFALSYFPLVFFIMGRLSQRDNPRIMIVLPSLQIGGLERLVLTLSKGLKEKGHYVLVYAYDQPDLAEDHLLNEQFNAAGVPV